MSKAITSSRNLSTQTNLTYIKIEQEWANKKLQKSPEKNYELTKGESGLDVSGGDDEQPTAFKEKDEDDSTGASNESDQESVGGGGDNTDA